MDIQRNHSTSNSFPVLPVRIIQASLCTLFAVAMYYRIRSVPATLAATGVLAAASEGLYRLIGRDSALQSVPPRYPVAEESTIPPISRYEEPFLRPYNTLAVKGRAFHASWMPKRLFSEGGCEKLVEAKKAAASSGKANSFWNSWAEKCPDIEQPDYIATQGPLEQTCEHFWEMVWEHQTPNIVCLANLRESEGHRGMVEKCYPYWPQDDQPVTFGPFTIQKQIVETQGQLVTTFLKVTNGSEKRIIAHLHHIGWGDHGTIEQSEMKALIKRDEELYGQSELQGPVVVHCSAGVGRTGTFLGCKIGYHNPKASSEAAFRALRVCRDGMVQNSEQDALMKKFYQS